MLTQDEQLQINAIKTLAYTFNVEQLVILVNELVKVTNKLEKENNKRRYLPKGCHRESIK